MIVIIYVYVKDFFFVIVLFFSIFFFHSQAKYWCRGEPQASDRFFAIRFKLCTFIISIIFSSAKTVDVFTYDKDLKMSRYCAY
jgi:hypothetical protein